MINEKLKSCIDDVEVVSFDIFDTLLLRCVEHPEDVFRLIELISRIDGFTKLRIELQHECSIKIHNEKGYPHADFDEIYEYIQIKENDKDVNWVEIKNLEFELESKLLVQNSYVKKIFDYAKCKGKRIIITSDMYLTKNQINNLLVEKGYSGYSNIYLSSDLKATKFEGNLFEKVIQYENIEPGKILHVGDNYEHDIVNAKKKGLQTWYYPKVSTEKQNSEIKLVNKHLESLHVGVSNMLLNSDRDKKSFSWYNLGVEVGGLLYLGLLNWITQKVKENKIDKIYMLSRDGYILQYIIKQLNLDFEAIYFLTSRRALLIPGITELNEGSLNLLPPYTFGQSVEQILEFIGMSGISNEELLRHGFKSRNDKIKNHEDIAKFKRLIKNNDQIFFKSSEEEKVAADNYMVDLGIKNNNQNDLYFFDTGWSGSSQKLLEDLLQKIGYKNKVKFLYLGILDTEKSKTQLNGKRYETYLFNIKNNKELSDLFKQSIVIPELFFTAPGSSILKYTLNTEDKVQYENNISNNISNELITGILDYLKIMYPLIEYLGINVDKHDSVAPLIRLIQNPRQNESALIGDIYNFDSYVYQKGEKKYIAKLNLVSLLRNPKIEIYWPQGLLARKDTNFFVKLIIKYLYPDARIEIKNRYNRFFFGNSKISGILKKSVFIIKTEGVNTFGKKVAKRVFKLRNKDDYQMWIKRNEIDIDSNKHKLEYQPLISIITPVYNVKKKYLEECIKSVINQTYTNWELCISDDASTLPDVKEVLSKYENHPKIKITYQEENGHISKNTNFSLSLAQGEYVAFLDCDDVLSKNAIYEVVKVLNEKPESDFIYSDEDKITEEGRRHTPYFKPDWSPDTLMSIMYTCHFSVYRKSILDKIGGFRSKYDGAQDYDMTLRFTEETNNIVHIPKILYHWREIKGSLSGSSMAKPYALKALENAKIDALLRRGIEGEVKKVQDMAQYNIVYSTGRNPLVSIVIPSKNNNEVFENCVNSIKKNTRYTNYEIILIDNGSTFNNQERYRSYCEEMSVTYLFQDIEFNFSKLNNYAVSVSNGEFLLFLNDDTEVILDNWLNIMLGQAMLNHVGAVGAKLYYPNSKTIQHTGITNLEIGPSHGLLGHDDRIIYYFGRNRLTINCIAVTAACLMIEKEKFLKVGGFDENLSVAYNDVDLCFKLINQGFYNVIRNDVVLYHYESLSRGNDDIDFEKHNRLLKERDFLYKKHDHLKGVDPFYNVNLTVDKVNYSINMVENTGAIVEGKQMTFDLDLKKVGNITSFVDSIKLNANYLTINGWAFNPNFNNDKSKIIILLKSNEEILCFESKREYRPDVINAFKHERIKGAYCGYICNIKTEEIKLNSNYQIGICVSSYNQQSHVWTDKIITL